MSFWTLGEARPETIDGENFYVVTLGSATFPWGDRFILQCLLFPIEERVSYYLGIQWAGTTNEFQHYKASYQQGYEEIQHIISRRYYVPKLTQIFYGMDAIIDPVAEHEYYKFIRAPHRSPYANRHSILPDIASVHVFNTDTKKGLQHKNIPDYLIRDMASYFVPVKSIGRKSAKKSAGGKKRKTRRRRVP